MPLAPMLTFSVSLECKAARQPSLLHFMQACPHTSLPPMLISAGAYGDEKAPSFYFDLKIGQGSGPAKDTQEALTNLVGVGAGLPLHLYY